MKLTDSHVAGLRLLIAQVRSLQRAHRAGITPHYGQLENLYETTDVVERQLDGGSVGALVDVQTCRCGKPAASVTADGQQLCVDCTARFVASMFAPMVNHHSVNRHGGVVTRNGSRP